LFQSIRRKNLIFVSVGQACRISDARTILQEDGVLRPEHLYVSFNLGAGSYQLYVALQDIEQLWKFVEFVPTEHPPDARAARVRGGCQQAVTVGASNHGAEFVQAKELEIPADPVLRIKDRAAIVKLDR